MITLLWMSLVWATEPPAPAEPLALRSDVDVGDIAPALTVPHWYQGEPVSELARGRVYVVEFWASWCPPCVDALPALQALQEAHRDDVTVFLLRTWEGDHDETRAWLAENPVSLPVGYAGAYEHPESPYRTWFSAAERRSIPSAFVVGPDGRIAFIGTAWDIDRIVSAILDGTWDLDTAKAEHALDLAYKRYAQFRIWEIEELPKPSERLAALDALARERPELAPRLSFDRYQNLLKVDHAEAMALGLAKVDTDWRGHSGLLLTVARPWTHVRMRRKVRLDLAMMELSRRAAEGAVNASGGRSSPALRTLAQVLWRDGEYARARLVQQDAVTWAATDEQRETCEGELGWYQRHAR